MLSAALSAWAQTPPPVPPPTPAPAPTPAPTPAPAPQEAPPPPQHAGPSKWFVGGGVGATFGTVDTISIAPLIGYHVIPRFDVGTQLFYQWVNDGRYSPTFESSSYGATLFARFRVWRALFLEGDYQYTNYEYLDVFNQKHRASYDAFLAGGGYAIPVGGKAAMYFSALYDFSYDSNDPYRAYDSPWRVQAGVTVGF